MIISLFILYIIGYLGTRNIEDKEISANIPEAFVVSLGKTVGDEYLRQHTEDFINWLL